MSHSTKSIEKVNSILEDYFDVNVSCSTDFYYCQEDDELGWTFMTVAHQDKNFCEFFEDTLGCPVCNTFIYSIFHEYGHKVTLPNFSKSDMRKYHRDIELIETYDDPKMRDFDYFQLPVELAASTWAVNYIKSHYEEIKEWYFTTVKPALDAVINDEHFSELVKLLIEEENI